MNLGTLTQFERSENYVPKYTESQVQGTQMNPRAMDAVFPARERAVNL